MSPRLRLAVAERRLRRAERHYILCCLAILFQDWWERSVVGKGWL